jgi:hypothetical protein
MREERMKIEDIQEKMNKTIKPYNEKLHNLYSSPLVRSRHR